MLCIIHRHPGDRSTTFSRMILWVGLVTLRLAEQILEHDLDREKGPGSISSGGRKKIEVSPVCFATAVIVPALAQIGTDDRPPGAAADLLAQCLEDLVAGAAAVVQFRRFEGFALGGLEEGIAVIFGEVEVRVGDLVLSEDGEAMLADEGSPRCASETASPLLRTSLVLCVGSLRHDHLLLDCSMPVCDERCTGALSLTARLLSGSPQGDRALDQVMIGCFVVVSLHGASSKRRASSPELS